MSLRFRLMFCVCMESLSEWFNHPTANFLRAGSLAQLARNGGLVNELPKPMYSNPILKTFFALLLILFGLNQCSAQTQSQLKNDRAIAELLQQVVTGEKEIPGVVAAIKRQGEPLRIAAAGVLKLGNDAPISINSTMHLGSCTKALTATLLARCVEQGKLSWDLTIKDGLPRLARKVHEDFHSVTLLQLLQHRGGIPPNASNWWMKEGTSIRKIRENIAADNLKTKPKVAPGSKYVYSNLSYMVAGMFAKKALSKSWEQIISDQLFEPLGMKSAGFGPPGKKNRLTEPWGHRKTNGKLVPIQHDNAPALGPAGTVHMTLQDWATFAMVHVDGKHNGQPFISDKSLRVLQTARAGQDYAAGWVVFNRPWGNGQVLTHSGSNTMWFSTIWVAPKTRTVYLIATNVSTETTSQVIDGLIYRVIMLDRKAGK